MAGKLVTKLSKRQCFTLTEKDTLKIASEKFQKYNVGVMPVLNEKDKNIISCNLNTSVTELMEIISNHKIRHIPIIEDKKLLGIVSIGDVVNHIIQQYKDENQQLRDFINQ